MRCPNCGYEQQSKRMRSSAENRYFHGIVLPIIAYHTGYSVDEVKDIVKTMFLKREMTLKTRSGMKEVFAVSGSSELSTAEFEAFMSNIRQWASKELGLWIPEPNEERHPVLA